MLKEQGLNIEIFSSLMTRKLRGALVYWVNYMSGQLTPELLQGFKDKDSAFSSNSRKLKKVKNWDLKVAP